MSETTDYHRRQIIKAAPALACLSISHTTAGEVSPPDIEALAAQLLDALNLQHGGDWAVKVGTDHDVVLFHRKVDT